jgi:uncharacterized protein (TIGR02145 family)
MNIFKQLCQTLVLSAVAVALSVGLMGCPPTDVPDDNPVTPNNNGGGSFSYNGQTYKTVKIGSQTWMAENLNYATDSSWCLENDEHNCTNKGKGRLYTWEMAMIVCPSGWHLPSSGEWDDLVYFVGGVSGSGKKLKTTTGWDSNGNGTDEFGFAAVPTGERVGSGFGNLEHAYWWTSSENDDAKAYYQRMYNYSNDMGRSYETKRNGHAVRCLKD